MTPTETIKALRHFKGYSQEYVANCLDMSQKNYSKIECGKNKLTIEHLEKIASILGVKAEYLLTFKAGEFIHQSTPEIENRIEKLENQLAVVFGMTKKILDGETKSKG